MLTCLYDLKHAFIMTKTCRSSINCAVHLYEQRHRPAIAINLPSFDEARHSRLSACESQELNCAVSPAWHALITTQKGFSWCAIVCPLQVYIAVCTVKCSTEVYVALYTVQCISTSIRQHMQHVQQTLTEGNLLYTSHLVRGMRGAESHQQQPPKGGTCPACLPHSSSHAVSSLLRPTTVAAASSNPGQQGGPLTKHTQYLCSIVIKACAEHS